MEKIISPEIISRIDVNEKREGIALQNLLDIEEALNVFAKWYHKPTGQRATRKIIEETIDDLSSVSAIELGSFIKQKSMGLPLLDTEQEIENICHTLYQNIEDFFKENLNGVYEVAGDYNGFSGKLERPKHSEEYENEDFLPKLNMVLTPFFKTRITVKKDPQKDLYFLFLYNDKQEYKEAENIIARIMHTERALKEKEVAITLEIDEAQKKEGFNKIAATLQKIYFNFQFVKAGKEMPNVDEIVSRMSRENPQFELIGLPLAVEDGLLIYFDSKKENNSYVLSFKICPDTPDNSLILLDEAGKRVTRARILPTADPIVENAMASLASQIAYAFREIT
jgi:hypothetical protein